MKFQSYLNAIFNLMAMALLAIPIYLLAPYMPALGLFLNAPYYEQAFVAFWFTLGFFILIIKLRDNFFPNTTIKNVKGWKKGLLALFGITDVAFNVWFSPFLLLQFANSYREGWTFTSHCKAIKAYSEKARDLSNLEELRLKLANFYGKIMNMIDEGHYS